MAAVLVNPPVLTQDALPGEKIVTSWAPRRVARDAERGGDGGLARVRHDAPAIVPMLALVAGTLVGGGVGVAFSMNVTSRLVVPCGAEDGLTLGIWLVLAACA